MTIVQHTAILTILTMADQ